MNLRKHQRETAEIVDSIVAGSPIKNIVADVCTGGGKSLLPVIAASILIPRGLCSKIAWICPRTSLQDQGERVFLDPRFRHELNHNLIIRSSTNQENPSRGTAGFTSTYQALAVDTEKTALCDFERFPYILVLDEYHHLAENGEWTAPIQELYERAAFRLLLTGTLSRGDQGKVAFTPYVQAGDCFRPSFAGREDTALVRYSRRDALEEKAIIPLEFHFAEGVARWRKESGKEIEAKLSTTRPDANQALFTALKTEYAEEMLMSGVAHWQNHRRHVNPNGSLMVVAANIETAKEYTALLKRQGLQAEIATSDDTPQALKHIKALKAGSLKIMVSVCMAAEGLDVPSLSHLICLTNIRTPEWLIQMCGRLVRINPAAGSYASQRGHIFAPADRMFVELAAKIEADQCEAVAKEGKARAVLLSGEQGELFGDPRPGITPLSSKLLKNGTGFINFPLNFDHNQQKTQKEIETELREECDGHVHKFCRVYHVDIKSVNWKLKQFFGKPREQMTVRELEQLRRYLESEYRVPDGRTGRAEVVEAGWR